MRASAALPLQTATCTCDGMMVMSPCMPNAATIRATFFSMRMQVAPQPSNHEAYSARNTAA